jgi:hypothetical protein
MSSLSRISNQTTNVVGVASGQDLSMSITNRKTLPLRPQDCEQINSQVAPHPDITSKSVSQDAQVANLHIEKDMNLYALNINADMLLLCAASEDHEGKIVNFLLKNAEANVARGRW